VRRPTGPQGPPGGEGGGRLTTRVGRLEAELAQTRRVNADLAHRLEQLETKLRTQPQEVAGPGRSTGEQPGARFASIYPAFQDRFRGSEAEITGRLAAYLPDVDRLVGAGGVVDIGPGRGEWLTLLHEHGIAGYGIDVNLACIAACRAKGLEVVHTQAAPHLLGLPTGSLDMVTAFHVIEHLDIDQLLELLEAAHQALRPGGCLLVETPNPTNLVMAACDFYNDPTHRAPLPPDLTEYLVGAAGFEAIEVRHLHPRQDRLHELQDEAGHGRFPLLAEAVAQRFFGSQDYAVLGYRPTPNTQSANR
jgi:SAM-dependent methyltransferase